MLENKITRRTLLRAAGAVGLTAVTGGFIGWARKNVALAESGDGEEYYFALIMEERTQQIFPGDPTPVWSFRGQLTDADIPVFSDVPNSYLGPILRLKRGQRVTIDVHNNLPEDSVVHWHGLYVPESTDGHPSQIVGPNSTYTVSFPIVNRAGTYWYHPHPDMMTAKQVVAGLAGLIIVTDDEEQSLNLPYGEQDIPIVIQDRLVEDNTFPYTFTGASGYFGDRILINGWPDAKLSVATKHYRFRILNGSNARIYKLYWNDGVPMTVIGTDGGLIEQPVNKDYITVAPGERVEIWRSFVGQNIGAQIELRSGAFFGHGMNNNPDLPMGVDHLVAKFSVDKSEPETGTLPTTLSTIHWPDPTQCVNYNDPRVFNIQRSGSSFNFDGNTFNMTEVLPNEIVHVGTSEIWKFVNGGGASHMAHPIHTHSLQFRVLERTCIASRVDAWNSVRFGYTDEGWKDTILLMPGETATILMRFPLYSGVFLYHCHNLEHEDMGMMRNYRVDP